MTNEELRNFFREREKQLVEGINLFERVKIRRISKEDLEDLKTSFFLPPEMHKFISPKMFVLEKYVTSEDGHGFHPREIMQRIVLALRLLKGGYVNGSYMFYILLSETRELTSWSREEAPTLGTRPWNVYVLDFKEIPTLRKIIRKIQRLDFSKRKSLYLACKRFQRAYEEDDDEDQLIDLMIAFEALFLKGEKAVSPAGHIIGIACSTLLGTNEEERGEIKRTLIEAYSIRNHIVHGSEYQRLKPIDKDAYEDILPDLVSEVENYLRESIKKLLD